MRHTLLPAAAVLLALTSCATHEEELRADLAAVPAEDQAASEPEEGAQEEPLVPVEVTSDLVDPEGSTVGTAVLRDTENGTELEVGVSGLTPGFHAMGVCAVGDCTAGEVPAGDPATAFPAAGALVTALPPVLVLDDGVGSLTTLVGPTPLEELLAGDGTAAIVDEAAGATADQQPQPDATRVACAAFAD
jgi:Cu/Zn superoxide dismutase